MTISCNKPLHRHGVSLVSLRSPILIQLLKSLCVVFTFALSLAFKVVSSIKRKDKIRCLGSHRGFLQGHLFDFFICSSFEPPGRVMESPETFNPLRSKFKCRFSYCLLSTLWQADFTHMGYNYLNSKI